MSVQTKLSYTHEKLTILYLNTKLICFEILKDQLSNSALRGFFNPYTLTHLLCKSLTMLRGNHSCCLIITFVANKNYLCILPWICLYLGTPVQYNRKTKPGTICIDSTCINSQCAISWSDINVQLKVIIYKTFNSPIYPHSMVRVVWSYYLLHLTFACFICINRNCAFSHSLSTLTFNSPKPPLGLWIKQKWISWIGYNYYTQKANKSFRIKASEELI